RVLVRAQSNQVENGIYDASTGDWQRSRDFNGNRDAVKGTLVVTDGVSTAFLFYRLTTADPVIIGTSAIVFTAASEVQEPYPRSPEEVSQSIVPVDREYPWGHVLRYGADPEGIADSTAAFNNAI